MATLKESNEKLNKLILLYKSCTDEKKKRVYHIKTVEAGMGLVKRIAMSISLSASPQYEDLVQVGAVGLIKAVEAFEAQRNTKFSTYATYYIKGEIRHYIRDKADLIKTPRKMQELLFKVYSARKEIIEDGNPEPTTEQIAEFLGISTKKIQEIVKIEQYKSLLSLDQNFSSDPDDVSLLDKIPSSKSHQDFDSSENKVMIRSAIEKLPEDLKEILKMNFFDELNQREISEKLGISQMQVSRRIKKALHKMYELIGKIQD